MRHRFDCLIQDRVGQVFGDAFAEYVQLKNWKTVRQYNQKCIGY
jgi:hypothetical protein